VARRASRLICTSDNDEFSDDCLAIRKVDRDDVTYRAFALLSGQRVGNTKGSRNPRVMRRLKVAAGGVR
jgi:hypothetical protein